MENAKKFNLFSCVMILISAMIGSAIFSLSGYTISIAGPSAVLSWIISAIIMLFYGLFMCELATTFPKSGGAFYFPYKALGNNEKEGKLWGYVSAFAYIISCIMAIAFSSSYVGVYLEVSFGQFANKQVLFAILTIVFAFIYNVIDLDKESMISRVLTIVLIGTLLYFIFSCMTNENYSIKTIDTFFNAGSIKGTGFLAGVPTAMVGYGSIVAMSFMVSEVKDRKKNLPLAAIIAMIIVALLYSLSIMSVAGLISVKELTESGMTYVPFFAVCFLKLNANQILAKVVSISAVIALITTVCIMTSLTAFALKALADAKIAPKFLSKENNKHLPANAALVVCIISSILTLFPSLISKIVSLGALLNVIGIFTHLISLYVARKRIKNKTHRLLSFIGNDIYRAPGNNVFIIVIMILIILCYVPDIITGGYKIWLFTIGLYIIGLIYYKMRVK